ncbi:M24 family metallopeptidase [Naasia aerilata]|uniref:Creatinase N-terminal domain-containing protein n=1 Tax=Naasia aerilata TaxID=1162966 RepID=A0ABN6XPE7_9MICO|nr:aminopeptidase P family N-terminal domain-containing protein [Naasia aerilata]BDZ46856.1 hypothetical protein GCM10025866_27650 [Naasia aerilata]
MTAETLPAPTAVGGAFSQRLPSGVYDRIQERIVARLESEGLQAILTDDPEDVSYLTGFFHHPGERPVAVLQTGAGSTVLLLPELERQHAEEQGARAEIVAFAEYPGIENPCAPLARAAGGLRGRVGVTTLVTQHRLAMLQSAFPDVEWVPTELVTRARYVKFPEEIAQHREAARITDIMLRSGVDLITEAIAAGGALPSEADLAGHVGRVGVGLMYGEHSDVVVISFLAGGLVYAGANSAIPHGLPSGYRLRDGDTFMLSLGAAVGAASSRASAPSCWASPPPTSAATTTPSVSRRPREPGDRARGGVPGEQRPLPRRHPRRGARPVPEAPAGPRHRPRHA